MQGKPAISVYAKKQGNTKNNNNKKIFFKKGTYLLKENNRSWLERALTGHQGQFEHQNKCW